MKPIHLKISVVYIFLALFLGCVKEEETEPFAPSIRFQGETNTVNLEPSKSTSIPIILKTPAGFKSLAVNGQVIETDGTSLDTVTYNYTTPETATIGGAIDLVFSVTDQRNVVKELTFKVNVIDFIAPVLTLVSTTASSERNQSVPVSMTFSTPNGIKSVTANGQTLPGIVEGSVTGTVNYDFTVPADAAFGALPVEFVLTDQREKTNLNTFTVTVIGSTINMSTLASGGIISTIVTLEKQNLYKLDASLSVATGGVLNIPEGTTIYAVTGMATPFTLTIENTGQINALGTASEPIVFTSDKLLLTPQSPTPGDWHGIRMNGGSGINMGTLRYVRIEYGGGGVFPNQQAALRLDGVTAPTTFEYIQVYKANHVGVFCRSASTASMKYVVATECAEASIFVRDAGTDPDFQFIILEAGAKTSLIVPSAPPAEGRMLEVRQTAGGATFSNMTIIGPGSTATGSMDAIRTDRKIQVLNSLVAEFPDDGIRYDVPADITTPPNFTGAVFAYSYIFKIFDLPTRDSGTSPLVFETNSVAFTNVIDKVNVPAAAAGISSSSFVPTALIPSTFDPTTLGANFSAAPFIGAIGATDWTTGGWVKNIDGTIRP